MEQFEQYVKASKKVPQEVLSSLASIDDPARLVDTIAAQMALKSTISSVCSRRRAQGAHRDAARV
jgi:ATP-dependent Lon protease